MCHRERSDKLCPQCDRPAFGAAVELHNESRESLAELAGAIGLPLLYMRTAVPGGLAARPLYDVVWLHQKMNTP